MLELDADLRVFRDEVAEFLSTSVPDDIRARVAAGAPLGREMMARWQGIVHARGWAAQGWPAEYGGCDWGAFKRYIYDEEVVRWDAPVLSPFGLYRLAPVIYTWGTPAQKERFLPPILDGSTWWCQGYSEPNAGSDLAALGTWAEQDGDAYVVNGTKTWTSMAHYADAIFCLVRTAREERPQAGITFLLIDLASEGVTVRPIPTLDGRANVNEVHFDNVRVPLDNRIGDEGAAWEYSRFLLGFERLQIADVPQSKRLWRRALGAARKAGIAGRADVAERLVRAAASLRALEITTLRLVARADAGEATSDEASILKVRGSRLRQELAELLVDLIGDDALTYDTLSAEASDAAVGEFLYSRASSIYGGSNEIQHTIIAKRVLGL